ncbi:MAG: hypothetical protein IKJ05_04595 [Oscillospiraceae bacterium]|nr:hypothetical protein [Oscillospiraceae bacterium]
MSIKNMLISLLAGSVMLGVGLAVTALEVSVWDTAPYPQYLEEMTVETQEFVKDISPEESEKINIYISTRTNGFRNDKLIEIVEDARYTDTIGIQVDYKGERPYVNVYDYNSDYDEDTVSQWLDIVVHPDYNYSLREIRQVAEDMFENKIFYTDNITTLVEKVTVYTATPEKFDVN